jgi:hypothetical protein
MKRCGVRRAKDGNWSRAAAFPWLICWARGNVVDNEVYPLAKAGATGLAFGAVIGAALSWALFVNHPVISQMIAYGPAPRTTLYALCGASSAFCAVAASLSAVTLHLLVGE